MAQLHLTHLCRAGQTRLSPQYLNLDDTEGKGTYEGGLMWRGLIGKQADRPTGRSLFRRTERVGRSAIERLCDGPTDYPLVQLKCPTLFLPYLRKVRQISSKNTKPPDHQNRVLKFCRMGKLAMRNSIMRLPAFSKLVRARLEYHRYLF